MPVTQGSMWAPRAGKVLHENGPELVAYRNAVGLIARRAMASIGHAAPIAGQSPIGLDLTFWLERRKTIDRILPSVKGPGVGDVDKYQRAVLDALTNVVYLDDGQVTDVEARKRYADAGDRPHLDVTVHLL